MRCENGQIEDIYFNYLCFNNEINNQTVAYFKQMKWSQGEMGIMPVFSAAHFFHHNKYLLGDQYANAKNITE